MSGNYHDGITQADLDRWLADECREDADARCEECGATADQDCDASCNCEFCQKRASLNVLTFDADSILFEGPVHVRG